MLPPPLVAFLVIFQQHAAAATAAGRATLHFAQWLELFSRGVWNYTEYFGHF